jgi:hypothetical protein
VPGLAEHQAAEALVLAGQGQNPGLIVHNGNTARDRFYKTPFRPKLFG